MKKNNAFFIVSLCTVLAIGAVVGVAVTAKAHKVSIREMRDRAVAEIKRELKSFKFSFKGIGNGQTN